MAKQRNNETTYRCAMCGEPLSEDDCRQVQSEFSQSGFSPYCVECESRIYNHFARSQGKYHALLTACGAFNVPCKPLLLDGVNLDEESDAWLLYINLLSESGQDTKSGKVLGFADGVTTLWGLFGNKLGEPNFEKRIALEKEKIKKQIGTPEQRAKWGEQALYKGLPISAQMYDELDRLYEIRANSYKGQTITPQMDDTLIKVAKSNVIYDHLMRQGLVKAALDVQKNIDLLLASEQMRKKDEKPVEHFRMDALVTALEKFGCMENGDFLNYDELVEVLRDNFVKSKKYDYSLDAADQVVLDIVNAMRKNADLLELSELPIELAVEDEYGEFEPEETEEEKKRKAFAGLTKVRFTEEKKGDDE